MQGFQSCRRGFESRHPYQVWYTMIMHPTDAWRVSLLALAIWREARGESFLGKIAVAEVVKERVESKRWPAKYEDVILQPWQFSAFNKNDPNAFKFPNPETHEWKESYYAAYDTYFGDNSGVAKGANHYVVKGVNPFWAVGHEPVVVIGQHEFYKL